MNIFDALKPLTNVQPSAAARVPAPTLMTDQGRAPLKPGPYQGQSLGQRAAALLAAGPLTSASPQHAAAAGVSSPAAPSGVAGLFGASAPLPTADTTAGDVQAQPLFGAGRSYVSPTARRAAAATKMAAAGLDPGQIASALSQGDAAYGRGRLAALKSVLSHTSPELQTAYGQLSQSDPGAAWRSISGQLEKEAQANGFAFAGDYLHFLATHPRFGGPGGPAA